MNGAVLRWAAVTYAAGLGLVAVGLFGAAVGGNIARRNSTALDLLVASEVEQLDVELLELLGGEQ